MDKLSEIKTREIYELQMAPGDYIVNGVLYCGRCRTPKTTKPLRFFNYECPRPVKCKCRLEELEKNEKERKERELREKIEKRRRRAFDGRRFAEATFETDDGANARLTALCRRYTEKFPEMLKEGKGLILCGGVGVGKTFAASCIANALLDSGNTCRMTSFSKIGAELFADERKDEYYNRMKNYDLLIIDDLNMERRTDYMNEIAYRIINDRYESLKPVIVTTNLSQKQLEQPDTLTDKRLLSRLREVCYIYEVAGKDRREQG